jgi:probable addiction module antidote protein
MARLAEASALGRESMYKALSEDGNPKIKTVQAVLKALGFRFTIAKDSSIAA